MTSRDCEREDLPPDRADNGSFFIASTFSTGFPRPSPSGTLAAVSLSDCVPSPLRRGSPSLGVLGKDSEIFSVPIVFEEGETEDSAFDSIGSCVVILGAPIGACSEFRASEFDVAVLVVCETSLVLVGGRGRPAGFFLGFPLGKSLGSPERGWLSIPEDDVL